MPGSGDIGGSSAVLKFTVKDKNGNVKTSWHAHDDDVMLGAGSIKIEIVQTGQIITVPLQPGPCVKLSWG